jgi:hypothetical protein
MTVSSYFKTLFSKLHRASWHAVPASMANPMDRVDAYHPTFAG